MMKKVRKFCMYISGLLAVIGTVLSCRSFKHNHLDKSITIIGGADGPTSIFMAGNLAGADSDVIVYCMTGFFILITIVFAVVRRRNK